MYLIRRLTLVVLLALPIAMAEAELPSESLLPGAAAVVLELPDESALPPYVAQRDAIVDLGAAETSLVESAEERTPDQSPPSNVASQTPAPQPLEAQPAGLPPRELPGEHVLPSQQGEAPPDADLERVDELAIKGSPDGIPWLRLNLQGHTAPLRAMAFCDGGRRLCTAGDDKSMIIWSANTNRADRKTRWAYERTVRWQVRRGLRGRIYALAASPTAVAMAGEGAMGGNGEILLIDPRSGQLVASLNDLSKLGGQVVVALSFSPSGQSLASLRMNGQLVQWAQNEAGLWKAAQVIAPDAEAYIRQPELIAQLLEGRSRSAVAAISDREIVAPVYTRQQDGRLIWRLAVHDVATGRNRTLAGDDQRAPHWDFVTAMAVDAASQRLISADGGGYIYLWDLRRTPAVVQTLQPLPAQVLSAAFDAEGNRVILGSDLSPKSGRATVEVWDVANPSAPRRLVGVESNERVSACRLSPDGRTFAWTAGARVHTRAVEGNAQQTLAAGATPPLKVAFPASRPFHRLGIGKQTRANSAVEIDQVFDTNLLRLDHLNQQQPATTWLPQDWLSRDWTVRRVRQEDGGSSLWFYEGTVRRGRIPLSDVLDGPFRSACWIPSRDAKGAPLAAAIGTGSGEIFVFRTTVDGVAPIIRRFRGHAADVTSLAVSVDLRYLASSSLDGTACVWPLAGLSSDGPLVQRWGAEFQQNGGELQATTVRPQGPIYFRGVRQGDRIAELSYEVGGEIRRANTADEMLATLANVDWRTQLNFKFARGRGAMREFQMHPAWQQLATLYVDDNGEWAYWNPAGYYDASFEGHKLFGWQINRGLEMLPDFFLAAQFRKQLERPRVMSQLLRSGDLESAFRGAQVEPPLNSPEALANAYRLKPQVEILSPRDGEPVNGTVKLTARLSVDAAQGLAPPKAFANGVVAVDRRLVSETVEAGERRRTYEWNMPLPSDERVLLQVAAATDSEVTETDQVVVTNDAPRSAAPARLFLLSVGVNDYRDAQIPKLRTAVQSTQDLLALLQDRTPELYRLDPASLLEERATKPAWRFLTDDFAAEFARGVSPDDLLVMFLSGHGVQAPGEAGYQFVTADARFADIVGERYQDCLSLADVSRFAEVPCRKLVILNTCHGGVVQPLMHRELKSAVRALQGDMLLTLAASGGEEEAVEGRFAKRLLEALEGAADDDGDGIVSLNEMVAYVQRTVAADSAGDAVRQTPSAGPKELLQFASVPLTKTDAAAGRAARDADATRAARVMPVSLTAPSR